jgi:hypothetical protein
MKFLKVFGMNNKETKRMIMIMQMIMTIIMEEEDLNEGNSNTKELKEITTRVRIKSEIIKNG